MFLTKSLLLATFASSQFSSLPSHQLIKHVSTDNVPIIGNIGLSHSDSCFGPIANDDWWSDTTKIFSYWTDYGWSWEEFTNNYNSFAFNQLSFLKITSPYESVSINQTEIKTATIGTKPTIVFLISSHHEGGFFGSHLTLETGFVMWHDQQNIYWRAFLEEYSAFLWNGSTIDVNYDSFIFKNE